MDQANDRSDLWLTVLFVLLLVAGLALLAMGVWLAWTRGEYVLLGLGLLAVSIPASVYAVANRGGGGDGAGQLREQLVEHTRLLRQLNERVLISDQAKRIAYRQKDRDALREAIVEDIRIEDYGAAMALVNEMTEAYGYREEGEQFRRQILEAQTKHRDAVIEEAMTRVDEACQRYDWDAARREVAGLKRMYPDESRLADLMTRIAVARERHKNELEREFLAAAEREDVERAMELMKEMDRYLTPEEAAPYLETARGVVGKKRDNAGVRFKMALQERDWIEAMNVGEQIMREFPNSQFAEEVRGMMDTLRERAAEQRAAAAGGRAV